MFTNIFYTYVYLDPRKPGCYECGEYKFDYEPFYVGKGHDIQYLSHLNEAKSSKRTRETKEINNV